MLGRNERIGRSPHATVTVLALLLAACSSGGSPTRAETVVLKDLAFSPATFTIQTNTTVRFTLVNDDTIDHEFVVGSLAVQQDHAIKAAEGAHGGHDPTRAAVSAGKTVEFFYTFDAPGTLLYGCHVAGHYAQGMRGTITVTA